MFFGNLTEEIAVGESPVGLCRLGVFVAVTMVAKTLFCQTQNYDAFALSYFLTTLHSDRMMS